MDPDALLLPTTTCISSGCMCLLGFLYKVHDSLSFNNVLSNLGDRISHDEKLQIVEDSLCSSYMETLHINHLSNMETFEDAELPLLFLILCCRQKKVYF